MAANPITQSGLDLSWLNLYEDGCRYPRQEGPHPEGDQPGPLRRRARGLGDMTYRMRGAVARGRAPSASAPTTCPSRTSGPRTRHALRRGHPAAVVLCPRHPLGDARTAAPEESSGRCASSAPSSPRSSSSPATCPGQWLPDVSAQDFEAGLFLVTQIMDEARHTDVFRKRALANGGGLLAQAPASACAPSSKPRLHRDVRAHARPGRRLRAVDVPHGRTHRPDRCRQAHLPPRARRTNPPPRLRRHAPQVRARYRARAPRRDPPLPRQGRRATPPAAAPAT